MSLLVAEIESDFVYERYDKLAFRYVSYVAIPALAIYAIYSLMYKTHRGWYSFIISTLTSFVYMFGFVRASDCFSSLVDLTRAIVVGRLNSSPNLLLTTSSRSD